jgi:hypothetical protein
MIEKSPVKINWTAVFMGFGVDWGFSELVGLLVTAIMLLLRGGGIDSNEVVPPDVILARQIVGVVGAAVGGVVAGYIARQRGVVHGVLGSVVGLALLFCSIPFLDEAGGGSLDIRDVGFIVLNLIGAGYGGGSGERWRTRRDRSA